MIGHLCALLIAVLLASEHAEALVLAISPLVEQPSREDGTEARPRPAAPTAPPLDSGKRELPPNPLWAIPLKQLSSTRERPIFSPSRRPPAPAVIGSPPPPAVGLPPKPAAPQNPELSLIGTVIGEKESIAVFVDDTTKNAVRLRNRETYKGWTLRSVRGREAILAKERETISLSLPQPGSEQTGSLPAAASNRSSNRRR